MRIQVKEFMSTPVTTRVVKLVAEHTFG